MVNPREEEHGVVHNHVVVQRRPTDCSSDNTMHHDDDCAMLWYPKRHDAIPEQIGEVNDGQSKPVDRKLCILILNSLFRGTASHTARSVGSDLYTVNIVRILRSLQYTVRILKISHARVIVTASFACCIRVKVGSYQQPARAGDERRTPSSNKATSNFEFHSNSRS